MSEYERCYREALEAAAKWCELHEMGTPMRSASATHGVYRATPVSGQNYSHPGQGYATAIRALASRIGASSNNKTLHRSYTDPGRTRIPPAPDDKALERMLLTALSQSIAWEEGDGEIAVRDIIVALREAGALRHEQ